MLWSAGLKRFHCGRMDLISEKSLQFFFYYLFIFEKNYLKRCLEKSGLYHIITVVQYSEFFREIHNINSVARLGGSLPMRWRVMRGFCFGWEDSGNREYISHCMVWLSDLYQWRGGGRVSSHERWLEGKYFFRPALVRKHWLSGRNKSFPFNFRATLNINYKRAKWNCVTLLKDAKLGRLADKASFINAINWLGFGNFPNITSNDF